VIEKNHEGEKMNKDLIKSNTVFNPAGLFDALWNESLNSMYPVASRISSSLRSDYFTENDEIVLNVDVAGATPEDVNVSFNKEKYTLTVQVAKQYVKKETKPDFFLRERMISDQSRSFRLPQEIDSNTISAEVKNGLLTVRVKILQSKPEENNVVIKVKS